MLGVLVVDRGTECTERVSIDGVYINTYVDGGGQVRGASVPTARAQIHQQLNLECSRTVTHEITFGTWRSFVDVCVSTVLNLGFILRLGRHDASLTPIRRPNDESVTSGGRVRQRYDFTVPLRTAHTHGTLPNKVCTRLDSALYNSKSRLLYSQLKPQVRRVHVYSTSHTCHAVRLLVGVILITRPRPCYSSLLSISQNNAALLGR